MNVTMNAVRNTRTAREKLIRQGDNTFNPAYLDCIADQLDTLGDPQNASKLRNKADAIRRNMRVQVEE